MEFPVGDVVQQGGQIQHLLLGQELGVLHLADRFFVDHVAEVRQAPAFEHARMQEILVDGFVAIANGENARLIENRLKGYFV